MNNKRIGIVGAGISGLHTAYELAKIGQPFILFEARKRTGGRISSPLATSSSARFDIGPSWFWPGQANVESLVSELGLNELVFEQYASGDALYEPIDSQIRRGVGGISMAGSKRLNGGLQSLTDTLRQKITDLAGEDSIKLSTRVSSVSLGESSIDIKDVNGAGWQCDKIVLALPPRVALNLITFNPALSDERQRQLSQVATWMAGHAKAVILYKTPFWRNTNLSGDIISHRGPLSEIHDASPFEAANLDCYGLFGFFATPPAYRSDDKAKVDTQIANQLTRIFGPDAASPIEIIYKDWAKDDLVASQLDQKIPNHHPSNHWDSKLEDDWQERLIWSGTESADGHYNGYIEGAIIASKASLNFLQNR